MKDKLEILSAQYTSANYTLDGLLGEIRRLGDEIKKKGEYENAKEYHKFGRLLWDLRNLLNEQYEEKIVKIQFGPKIYEIKKDGK